VALDFVLYDLRHTFATRMAQEGSTSLRSRKSSATTRSESWNVTFTRRTSTRRVRCSGTKRVRWRGPKLDRPKGPIEAELLPYFFRTPEAPNQTRAQAGRAERPN
jgi:hypothetical protein